MADIVRAKLESKPLEVRNPESTRPWQHVLDPLTGYISAVEHSLNCPIKHTFNFGPSEPALKVREILDIVNEIWPDLEIEDSNTNFSKRESRALELDSTYAEKHIGWRPKFTQKEAVTETLKWWEEKESGKLPVKEIVDLQIQRYMRISTL
jgi:CDP-glucose 4,6-dehydratase